MEFSNPVPANVVRSCDWEQPVTVGDQNDDTVAAWDEISEYDEFTMNANPKILHVFYILISGKIKWLDITQNFSKGLHINVSQQAFVSNNQVITFYPLIQRIYLPTHTRCLVLLLKYTYFKCHFTRGYDIKMARAYEGWILKVKQGLKRCLVVLLSLIMFFNVITLVS